MFRILIFHRQRNRKMLNIKNELLVFFCACLTGVNVRAGYEILIFLRKMIIHNNLVKGIEDLFYWIFMSAYIFSQIYATTYGSIRWYFLLGLVFGVAVKYTKKQGKTLKLLEKTDRILIIGKFIGGLRQ